MKKIEVLGLQSVPEIKHGDNLAEIIVKCADCEIGGLQEKDIVVLTSKIVSKAAGLTKKLSDVKPGEKALMISRKTGKDAKWLQMIFDEGHKILAIMPLKGIIEQHIMNSSDDKETCRELIEHEQALCVTLGKDGRIYTCDSGIDSSNHPPGVVSFLPEDPDKAAKEIREQIQQLCGRRVAVILADTEIIPFGTMDFAVGSSGIEPRAKMFAKKDLFGKPKLGGIDLIAYELTAASALVFGQINAGIPAAVVRGYEYEINETANIANSIIGSGSAAGDTRKAIKATMKATSYAIEGLGKKLLLRIASWFV
jgi:coenzyme F420-0:L-glutamate ligase/coenzyme F420-1:gamma-L-glutamate ligase